MKPGETFELHCYDYLKTNYKTEETDFWHEGGMDSTTSDIAVTKNGETVFYIEAKDALAHSGQFVLLPDEENHVFVFSPRNRSTQNEMTHTIIQYMNQDFHRFNRAGTAGQVLHIDTGIFANWIIGHYQNKGVKYIISYAGDYVIFPVSKLGEYFHITACYRIKKSGSGEPAKKDLFAVKKVITDCYRTANFSQIGKKLYMTLSEPQKNDRFVIGQYTFFLSPQGGAVYEIRKLSNTYNMNVIFSVELIKQQDKADLEAFKAALYR